MRGQMKGNPALNWTTNKSKTKKEKKKKNNQLKKFEWMQYRSEKRGFMVVIWVRDIGKKRVYIPFWLVTSIIVDG